MFVLIVQINVSTHTHRLTAKLYTFKLLILSFGLLPVRSILSQSHTHAYVHTNIFAQAHAGDLD